MLRLNIFYNIPRKSRRLQRAVFSVRTHAHTHTHAPRWNQRYEQLGLIYLSEESRFNIMDQEAKTEGCSACLN